MSSASIRRLIRFLCAASILIAVPDRSAAFEIPLGSAPTDPVKAGFRLTVVSQRLSNEGFQPLKLRFAPIGKSFTRQRNFRILLRPRSTYQSSIDYQYAVDITVPEGATTYDAPILLPCYLRWEWCAVVIEEDGRRLDRSPPRIFFPPSAQDWGQHLSVGIVVPKDGVKKAGVWEQFPDTRAMVTVLGDNAIPLDADTHRLTGKQAFDYATQLQAGWLRFRDIGEQELPSSWLEYSQLDALLIPFPVLARIEVDLPDSLIAIQHWVATGGQLWTYDLPVGGLRADHWLSGNRDKNDVRFIADPKKSMNLGTANQEMISTYQPWGSGGFYADQANVGQGRMRREFYDDLAKARNPMVATIDRNQFAKTVQSMPYAMGRVVLIDQKDPFPGSFQLWKAIGQGSPTWNERNGVDYANGTESFWQWMMSTVGRPPVTMFVLLNGLFVLVMGPLLYFVLRRRGRLYLLYFLAPALAFFATSSLFLYAFMSDGLANRARLRQLTWIDATHARRDADATDHVDQQRYPTVNQIRHTYYTVVDSGQGLTFPLDSLVLPVKATPNHSGYSYRSASAEYSGDYLIDQMGRSRRYHGAFLATRAQTHFTETSPTFEPLPIQISMVDTKPEVKNHLDSGLNAVAFRDENGAYWAAYGIASGASSPMEKVGREVFSGLIVDKLEPETSQIPAPFQNRLSMEDRTELESHAWALANHQEYSRSKAFIAITEVESKRFALRDCDQEECHRVIIGVLP